LDWVITVPFVGDFFAARPVAKEPMVNVSAGYGRVVQMPKSAMQTSALVAPLDEPLMKIAIDIVRIRNGGDLSQGDGAQLSFRSSEGRVTISASNLAQLNNQYLLLKN
jgi:hypothetical protein